jgi:type IV pilus assembly protein PilW
MTGCTSKRKAAGFGLLELMIAITLGLIVITGVLVIFLAQQQVYNSSTSQSLMQDSDNAISAVITPVARGVGFMGCGAINSSTNAAVTMPSLPTTLTFESTAAVHGYTGTLPSSVTDDAANVTTTGDWSPSIDASIVTAGGAEQGSDILVLFGAKPYATPIGISGAVSSATLTVNDPTQLDNINSGGAQVVAISDCAKSVVTEATAISSDTVTLESTPSVSFNAGAQLIPLQQTMFFVGNGTGGQSGLFEAVMTIPSGGTASTASWKTTEMVPGVLAMKVLYGIGSDAATTEYVDASKVTDWADVTAIKLAFLVEGEQGSATKPSASTDTYAMFNGTYSIAVPSDTRMRHVFYMTINTRNATL